jgi:hypothetical protein
MRLQYTASRQLTRPSPRICRFPAKSIAASVRFYSGGAVLTQARQPEVPGQAWVHRAY